MENFSFGFVGVGAGGNKIVDCFADEEFDSIVINTAPQDLEQVKNTPEDQKIHTKINETGGAGKDIRLGEKAIKKYKGEIKDNLEITFKNSDFVFVVAGLGGGSGTLGCVQVSRILAELGQKHGIIATIPTINEDSVSVVNSVAGIEMIEKARQRFRSTLRTVILIDNQNLKDYIFENSDISYEELWDRANQYIRDSFLKIYEFTKESGQQNIDTTDYVRLFNHRGYMLFGQGEIETENSSRDVLSKEIRKYWDNDIYLGGDVKEAKGVAVIVNRKEKRKNGKKIDNLFNTVKQFFGSVHFVPGVYSVDNKISFVDKIRGAISTEKENPVEIHTMLTGLPFPIKRIKELDERAKEESKGLYAKDDNSVMYEVDKNVVNNVFDEEPSIDINEEEDFGYFEDDEVQIEKKDLDWNKIKDL